MFNFEGRQNLDRRAALCCPSATRVIMLLILSALLALAVPAAHAAGCTAFEGYVLDGKDIGYFHVMVPASNFLSGLHKIYFDEKCDVVYKAREDADFGPGKAFAKNGRKAMEICELNMDETVAEVRWSHTADTMYVCVTGERKVPERQRLWLLYTFIPSKELNAKQALKQCRKIRRDPRPNHVEPNPHTPNMWHCYRKWTVNNRYLKRVGA